MVSSQAHRSSVGYRAGTGANCSELRAKASGAYGARGSPSSRLLLSEADDRCDPLRKPDIPQCVDDYADVPLNEHGRELYGAVEHQKRQRLYDAIEDANRRHSRLSLRIHSNVINMIIRHHRFSVSQNPIFHLRATCTPLAIIKTGTNNRNPARLLLCGSTQSANSFDRRVTG